MLQKAFVVFPIFCLQIIVWPVALQAQNCIYEIKGLIEDTQGEALVGATILLENLKTGTASDIDGAFTLKNLCAGPHSLLITYLGYEDERITVRLPVSKVLVIKLKPSVRVLHDIVIEGDHSQQHGLSQSLNILTEEQLSTSRGKALGEMLQQVPGVTNIMSGPGVFKPVINGLHSQRILILNNGVKQEGQQWGIDHAPEIDPYIASELEVVKGAEAVRYGAEAMGGVIIINPAPLHFTPGLGGELNLALESNNRMGVFSGMLEGGIKKKSGIAWRVQGTLKKGGDHHSPDYILSNTGRHEKNFSMTWGFRKDRTEAELFLSSFNTEIGILRSAHSGNLSDLQSSILNNRPWYIRKFTYKVNNPRQEVGHHLLKAKIRKEITTTGTLNLMYAGQYNQRKEFDIRRDRKDIPALSLDLYTHVLDASLDYSGEKWSGSYGIGGSLKENDNHTGIGLLPDYSQYSGGVFGFQRYKRGKWLFELGARFDHQWLEARMIDDGMLLKPSFSFNLASASLGGAVFLNEYIRFSSNLGVSTRAPLVNELFSQGLHHGSASIEEGLMIKDGGIQTSRTFFKHERSYKWVNTFQLNKKDLSIEFSAFINSFDDFIYLSPYDSRLTIRGFFPVFQYRQNNALLMGADFSLEHLLSGRWKYSGKASYVWAENRENREKLPFVPPVDFENVLMYTIPKAGKWKSIQISLISKIFLEQTRAPRTIYPEDVPDDPGTGSFDFMPPPDGYTLVGIDISGNLPVGNKDLTISLSGENLLNTRYRNYLNRLRYYADETGRNMTIRISYKFHSHP